MKIAIVGSRDYPNLQQVSQYVQTLPNYTVIVSGGARGVDRTAEQAARRCGLETDIYPADWNRYGKSAGYRRNAEIVAACDVVVAFWDGKSRGTSHTLDLARKAGKPITIYRPEGEAE
jgi:predicted Rossmann fold nucleotide-binding protein DprA/Smf involved in DNA uptake